jgi:hypothetical protein
MINYDFEIKKIKNGVKQDMLENNNAGHDQVLTGYGRDFFRFVPQPRGGMQH